MKPFYVEIYRVVGLTLKDDYTSRGKIVKGNRL